MNNLFKYCIVWIVITTLMLIYGFIIGGELAEYLLIIMFSICFSVLAILNRKQFEKTAVRKIIKTTLVSIVMVALSAYIYYGVNRLGNTLTTTYETTVTEVIYNRGGTVDLYFNDPSGNEKHAEHFDLNNLKFVLEEDDRIEKEDTIQINGYTGLFGIEYCVLVSIK